MGPHEDQQRLFQLPIDELYLVCTWTGEAGWSMQLRARPEGGSWREQGTREAYEHLSTDELLSLLPDAIERLRGF